MLVPDDPAVALSEIVRNYAIIVGGAVGLGLAFWRGIALSRQSKASVDQANIARRAHIAEVFKDAVGQLGDEKLEIRLGAIFTLQRVKLDFPEFRHYVVQVFTAYVREQTTGKEPGVTPSPDIREIMQFLSESLDRGE
jgi:hypothetical protein